MNGGWEVLPTVISIIGVISGIVLGWVARAKTSRKEATEEAAKEAAVDSALRIDVDYIRRGVDEIKFDIKSQANRIEDIDRRVTRVEESAKSAHKRVDRIDDVLKIDRREEK